MRVALKLCLDIHDLKSVVAAGDGVISDGWGYSSVSEYLSESEDTNTPLEVQAIYEIITAGLWTMLEKHGVLGGSVEIVDHHLKWSGISEVPEKPDEEKVPPEHPADAWRRYQENGDVTQGELRELDEWRTDVAQDKGEW